MLEIIQDITGTSIKLFALMTPPAVLSAFLGNTRHTDRKTRRRIALKCSLAIFLLGFLLYMWGADLFEIFGFTLDAFRIGSGVLLMLTAIDLMRDDGKSDDIQKEGDISIVPLAIPLGMGPASIGAIMVMGAQSRSHQDLIAGVFSLFLASLGMYLLLRSGDLIGKILHETGIIVLAKLTGLILAAIAAQVTFTGVAGFIK